MIIFAVVVLVGLAAAQPDHLRAPHLRPRRQRRGRPPRRHRHPPAHRSCCTSCRACAAASPPSCSIARTTTGSSTHGSFYELDAIAAVIIGGTLLTGGTRHPDRLDPRCPRLHRRSPTSSSSTTWRQRCRTSPRASSSSPPSCCRAGPPRTSTSVAHQTDHRQPAYARRSTSVPFHHRRRHMSETPVKRRSSAVPCSVRARSCGRGPRRLHEQQAVTPTPRQLGCAVGRAAARSGSGHGRGQGDHDRLLRARGRPRLDRRHHVQRQEPGGQVLRGHP